MQRVINIWNQWNGYLEKKDSRDLGDFTPSGKIRNAGKANYTCIARDYKAHGGGCGNPNPYCAMGVSEAFAAAYGLENAKKLLCGKLFHYCPDGANAFQAKGRLYTSPKVGDVVFFHNGTRFYHTGLVIAVSLDGKTFTTAEANTSSAPGIVIANGGAVRVGKVYTLSQLSGVKFGRPDYAGIVGIQEVPETKTEPTGWIFDSKENKWWFRWAGGHFPKNNWYRAYCASDKKYHWFLFDPDGWMLTGHQEFCGKEYYLCEAGPLIGACMASDENGALHCLDA